MFSAKADKKRLRRQKKISKAQLNPIRNSIGALNLAGIIQNGILPWAGLLSSGALFLTG
jgi:hypothetical protein